MLLSCDKVTFSKTYRFPTTGFGRQVRMGRKMRLMWDFLYKDTMQQTTAPIGENSSPSPKNTDTPTLKDSCDVIFESSRIVSITPCHFGMLAHVLDLSKVIKDKQDSTNISPKYHMIAFKMLMRDESNIGEMLSRYMTKVTQISHNIPHKQGLTEKKISSLEMPILDYTISTEGTEKNYCHVEESTPETYDAAIGDDDQLLEQVNRMIDAQAINCVDSSVEKEHTICVEGVLLPENLNLAIGLIEEHEFGAANIIMNRSRWTDVMNWVTRGEVGVGLLSICTMYQRNINGIYGYYNQIPIRVCYTCPKNAVYVLAKNDLVGAIFMRSPITRLVCRRDGILYKEMRQIVGICVLNLGAVVKIMVD